MELEFGEFLFSNLYFTKSLMLWSDNLPENSGLPTFIYQGQGSSHTTGGRCFLYDSFEGTLISSIEDPADISLPKLFNHLNSHVLTL